MKRNILTTNASARGCRAIIAAIIFCLSALSAKAQTVTVDHVNYSITNSTQSATAIGIDDVYLKSIVIADSVANSSGKYFPVTAIGSKAFQNSRSVSSVTFGSCLTKIGSYAFAGCNFLTEIHVPEGVVTIDNYAFQNCSIRYAELPSTLRSLGSSAFKTNSEQALDTLVLHTAYYDETGGMNVLPFSSSIFNSTIKKTCVLMVPRKAYDWYVYRTVNNDPNKSLNWGSFFTNIVPFGTAPTGCTVVPRDEELKSYRDLSSVEVTFDFDDEEQADLLSFAEDDHIAAILLLPDGTRLDADSVFLEGNTISMDFAKVLQQHREHFIAPSDDVTTINVELLLDGQIQLEECPFMLGSFFESRPIRWQVPLLPSVYDLPEAPEVLLASQAESGRYDYKAFESVTLKFDGYTALSLDSTMGGFINARLFKDGELISSAQQADSIGPNTLTIPFTIPSDALLVRRTSGVESYVFTLEVEGQVSMMDSLEAKNFRFRLPVDGAGSAAGWLVRPIFIPEPTDAAFFPAEANIGLEALTDIAVCLNGVSQVALSSAASASVEAVLYMEGRELQHIDAGRMRVEGNRLHLLFDPVDAGAITLITSASDCAYRFAVSLVADLLTDGYPCRVVIGESSADAADGNSADAEAPYTLRWKSPVWTVGAITRDVPEYTIGIPAATDDECFTYDQLRVIVIDVDNYSRLTPLSAAEGSNAFARLVRYGNPVCATKNITVEGNRITIDFGDKLDYYAVGITPDDAPDQLVALSLHFEGEYLFDGLPYRLVVDGSRDGVVWSVQPVVVYKLNAPGIECEGHRIFFTSGVEGVEYHYTISNTDGVRTTTAVATKTDGGSRLVLPLMRSYEVSVYTSREGYEDSDVVTATLVLGADPVIEIQQQ